MTTQLDNIEALLRTAIPLLTKLLEKKKPRARVSKHSRYPLEFEGAWLAFPKRAGSNPKQKAKVAYMARVGESTKPSYAHSNLLGGVKRYAKFCDATGITGTQYVMQAATFFGPDKHYENDWAIPKQVDKFAKPDVYSQSHKTYDPDAKAEIAPGIDPYENM